MCKELKWRLSEVEPQNVRDALQNIQLGGEFDSLGRVLVTRDVVAASRYAIEKLKTESNDLLSALKCSHELLWALLVDSGKDPENYDALGKARAAIAKAEGGQ